jgi:hypothetical protein
LLPRQPKLCVKQIIKLFIFLEYYEHTIGILRSKAVAGTMNIRVVFCGASLHIFKQRIKAQASPSGVFYIQPYG